MVDAIRQAKAGRRGDPLVLLREGSSLLPPQNYNLRQYQAPPSWELAGTGGYHPQQERAHGTERDAPSHTPRDSSGAGGGDVTAADNGGRCAGRKDGYRQMLDSQIRDKNLRATFEQRKLAEEGRAADKNSLPSYLNSNRGGGGDAMRQGDFARYSAGSAEHQLHFGPVYPRQVANHGEYRGQHVDSTTSVPPLHGRRSQHGTDDRVAGANDNALSSIEEEKTIEQKLYEPTSPQHARFRLSHADPETQAAMLKKEQERKVMREILAAQIAEKEEQRQVNLREVRKRDAAEYQREQHHNSAHERRPIQGMLPGEQPQDNYSSRRQQDQHQHQHQHLQPPPSSLPPQQQHPPPPPQQPQPQRPPDDFKHAPPFQEQATGSHWHGDHIHIPPPNAVLDLGHDAPTSARNEVGGNAGRYQRSDSDGGLFNLQYATNSSGSEKYTAGSHDWGTAELFAAAPRDSLDELKSLCKDLLIEQQELRSQLANQSNVVSGLRIAASARERGQSSRVASRQQGGHLRYNHAAEGSSTSSRTQEHRVVAHSSHQHASQHQQAAHRFGQVDPTVAERRGVEARQWGGGSRQAQNQRATVSSTSGQPGKPTESQPQWLRQQPQEGDTRSARSRSAPKSPPIPTHQVGRKPTEFPSAPESGNKSATVRPAAEESFADKFRAPAAGRRARKSKSGSVGQADANKEQPRRPTPVAVLENTSAT